MSTDHIARTVVPSYVPHKTDDKEARRILAMRETGKSYAMIAEHLGTTEPMVKMLVAMGRNLEGWCVCGHGPERHDGEHGQCVLCGPERVLWELGGSIHKVKPTEYPTYPRYEGCNAFECMF